MIKQLQHVKQGEKVRLVDGREGTCLGEALESLPPYYGIQFDGGDCDYLLGDTVVEIIAVKPVAAAPSQFNIGVQETQGDIIQGNLGRGQFSFGGNQPKQPANNTGITNYGRMGNVNTGSGQQFNIGRQKAKGDIHQGNF